MRGNTRVRFYGGGIHSTYPNLFPARPMAERPTLLRLRGLFNYEDRSWKNILPIFFPTRNFENLQENEIATGGDAIKK